MSGTREETPQNWWNLDSFGNDKINKCIKLSFPEI